MRRTSPNIYAFPQMKRTKQETLSYCGPAVTQMLLSFYGIDHTQDEIVNAAQVRHKIETHGMTIPEMATAVRTLEPQMQFWFKHYSTVTDLSRLINFFGQPVAIEWQGVFIYATKEDEENDDPGHYSIVTQIDTYRNLVMLADPFRDFAGTDRHFTVLEFERRWWEINEVLDPHHKHPQEIHDYHSMFFIAPKSASFPEQVGMQRG